MSAPYMRDGPPPQGPAVTTTAATAKKLETLGVRVLPLGRGRMRVSTASVRRLLEAGGEA